MPISRIAIGTREEATHPSALKAALAEFISTLIFVFAGQGSGMAFDKLTGGASTTPAGLVAASLAHGFGLFVAVSVGANISGGHVNPVMTFGAFVGGNITLLSEEFSTGLRSFSAPLSPASSSASPPTASPPAPSASAALASRRRSSSRS